MNTSKQINIMIGLMFLLIITLGIYFVWDQNVRAQDASRRQVEENAIRGGKVFALNCRVCHGDTGRGYMENPNLPGPPLNLEAYRVTDPTKLKPLQQRLYDTLRCGRVGTLMPPWSQEQGGTLTDTQIWQLVTLITGSWLDEVSHDPSAVSKMGWEAMQELAHELDTIRTPQGDVLRLAADVGPFDAVLPLNDAHVGLSVGQLLRIEDEVVEVKSFAAFSSLARSVSATDRVLPLESSADFRAGIIVQAEGELMRVVAVDPAAKTITVERGVQGTTPAPHKRGVRVQDPSNEIVVERGVFGTEAASHAAGTQVLNGPIPPPTGPLTGEGGTPPCGQRPPAPAAAAGPAPTLSPGQPAIPPTAQPIQAQVTEPTDGVIQVPMRDNIFVVNNLKVKAGQEVTIRIINEGQNPHNLRVAGPDGQWGSGDDFAVPADGSFIQGGQQAEAVFTPYQPGVYSFRCDVHPTDMWGIITVEQ